MTLAQLLENIESMDDDLTIYAAAEPLWDESSEAVACREPDDASLPTEATGMTYLLEVSIAKEVVKVWSEWRNHRTPSASQKCEAVIYYAYNDSYLPV